MRQETNGKPPRPSPSPSPTPLPSSAPPPLTLVAPSAVSDPRPQTQKPVRTRMDELPHSPLRSGSPLSSDQSEKPAYIAAGGGEKYYSPLNSPLPDNATTTDDFQTKNSDHSNSHVISFNRAVREDATQSALVVVPRVTEGGGGGVVEGESSGKQGRKMKGVRFKVVEDIVGRSKRVVMVKRAAIGLRLTEIVLCLISFSIMAADKTQGWSGDSFDRYKEYRFCLSVNVIAFAYAGFQAYSLGHHLVTGKHILTHHLHYHFDFTMDQILAYLLISASSAAATRVVDWESNWGKDQFTEKASASVSMSFLAFFAFAFSSLISGYNICNRDLS